MNKAQFRRFETYLKTDIGQLDYSLFGLELGKYCEGGEKAHVVKVIQDSDEFFFIRSNASWNTGGVFSHIIRGMSKKKQEAFLMASASARKFDFVPVGNSSVFTNSLSVPASRNLPTGNKSLYGLKTTIPSFSSMYPGNWLVLSNDAVGGSIVNYTSAEFGNWDISQVKDWIDAGDFDHLYEFLKYRGFTHPTSGLSKEEPLVCDFATVYPGSGRSNHALWIATGDPETGEFDPDTVMLAVCSYHIYQDGTNPQWDPGTVLAGIAALMPKFWMPTRSKWGTHPTGRRFVDTMVEFAKKLGIGATGRMFSCQRERGFLGDSIRDGRTYPSLKARTPFFGPGKGTLVIELKNTASYVFELESPPTLQHDGVHLCSDGNDKSSTGGVLTLFNTVWTGGRCSDRNWKWSDHDLSGWRSVVDPEKGFGLKDVLEDERRKGGDPFAGTVRTGDLIQEIKNQSVHSELPLPLVYRLHNGDGSQSFVPLANFLTSGKVFFRGDPIIEEDISLITENAIAEGSTFDHLAEVVVPGSDDFGSADEGGNFDPWNGKGPEGDGVDSPNDGVSDDPDREGDEGSVAKPVVRRTTLLRYSVVRLKHTRANPQLAIRGLAHDSAALESLKHGQGIMQPMKSNAVADLKRLQTEIGARSLSSVTFQRDVDIPFNISDKLIIARDYAKAKKKACQTNDWDKQNYAKGVKWGQVKATMNNRRTLKHIYHISDIVDIDNNPISSDIKGLQYVVGTSPAEIKMTHASGDVSYATSNDQDEFWFAIGSGVPLTGITMSTLSTSWGLEDNVETKDVGDLKDAVKGINQASDPDRGAVGAGPYVLDTNVISVAGYPEVTLMNTDDAYKSMIASVILYEGAGNAIRQVMYEAPQQAVRQYITNAVMRISKLREKYAAEGKS